MKINKMTAVEYFFKQFLFELDDHGFYLECNAESIRNTKSITIAGVISGITNYMLECCDNDNITNNQLMMEIATKPLVLTFEVDVFTLMNYQSIPRYVSFNTMNQTAVNYGSEKKNNINGLFYDFIQVKNGLTEYYCYVSEADIMFYPKLFQHSYFFKKRPGIIAFFHPINQGHQDFLGDMCITHKYEHLKASEVGLGDYYDIVIELSLSDILATSAQLANGSLHDVKLSNNIGLNAFLFGLNLFKNLRIIGFTNTNFIKMLEGEFEYFLRNNNLFSERERIAALYEDCIVQYNNNRGIYTNCAICMTELGHIILIPFPLLKIKNTRIPYQISNNKQI